MNQKTYLAWLHTRNWCESNPEKIAAIITPYGRFEIKYIVNQPRDIKLEVSEINQFDWIKKKFLEN